ncbi:hypothetical protein [Paraburkholderia flagellata]|uniref:hypothetical protein n=1 Tax=Paraburkholderia flagellata TaxID=2883241 RepID=UPI001F43746A|nr:hypothetical protein [Paraburkholderia flagellata]
MTNAGKKYDTVVAKNYVDCNNRDEAFVVAQTFYNKKWKDLGTSDQMRTIEVEEGPPMFSFVKGACTIAEAKP